MNHQIDVEQSEAGRALSRTHERHAWRAGVLTRLNRWRQQLIQRWWIVLASIFLGLAVQSFLWRYDPPLFSSSGRMIVSLKLSIPEGSLYTEELNNFLGTQAALMQSGVVLDRAHERVLQLLPGSEPQAVALKVMVQPKTTIFLLQGTGGDAPYTRAFVQACMEEYINLKRDMRAQTSDTTLAGMTEEVLRLEKELRKSDEDLVAFQSSNSVVLLQEQGASAGAFLASLNGRLAALKSEESLLQALDLDQVLERHQSLSAVPLLPSAAADSQAPLEPAALVDSDYLRARQQILLLKTERDDLARDLRPKHPKMLALAEELARRERLLEIFRQQSREQLESRKQSLQVQIRNLELDVREWEAKALDASRRNAEFQRLKANSQRTQALYDRLLAAMQTLDVNKQISPETVSIMEKASPALAERRGLAQKLLTGAALGLVGALLLLLLLDRLDDRLGSLSELEDLFPEQIVGQIPRERSALRRGDSGLLCPADQRYAFVEAYRNLRSSLLYMAGPHESRKTLLITSSVPNDGKSLTAANLAITLASAGAKVLLVDADLRKGSLHNRFGLAAGRPGLSECLENLPGSVPQRDEAAVPGRNGAPCAATQRGAPALLENSNGTGAPYWTSFVQATRVPNLDLLPRGGATHRSSELFLCSATGQFLQDAARLYDFVLLDTAPVMAADDVTSLAPQVDGVLFVVRAEHTGARVARAALDLLYLRQVRVLGLVFNAVRPASADYYYYYQYKDYHHSFPAA